MSRSEAAAAVELAVNGRKIALVEHGDPAGRPVFLFHGTPASRVGFEYTDQPARERGIRVICPDRPGIGRSEPLPSHTLGGYAGEVLALADALAIDRFSVIGYSCGGPFALSCAAGGGPRVTAVALMAGAGPVDDRDGARAGMAPSDLQLMMLSLHQPGKAARQLRIQRFAARLVPRLAVNSIAAEVSPPDRAALAGEIGPATVRSFVEAMRHGPAGVVADYQLYARPWDIAWPDIAVPVHLFQGDADKYVPMHHAEDIVRRLRPGIGHLRRLEGDGHFSITTRIGEILDSTHHDG
jgi:pimeloyl-ACP methyl ester carboxylesterase